MTTQAPDPWDYFNFDLIMQEANMRHADAQKSTAAAITPEKRTMNYWVAFVAHANAVACMRSEVGEKVGEK